MTSKTLMLVGVMGGLLAVFFSAAIMPVGFSTTFLGWAFGALFGKGYGVRATLKALIELEG